MKERKEKPQAGLIRILIDITAIIICVIAGFSLPKYLAAKSEPENTMQLNIGNTMKPVPAADLIASNVIYKYNQETNGIETILLEILNTTTAKLTYIVVPVETSFTMSPALYQKLVAGNVTLPQTVRLSELYKYYESDRAFDAGKQIISQMSGVNIRFYTGMEASVFDSVFSGNIETDLLTVFNIDEQEVKYSVSAHGSVKKFIQDLNTKLITDWGVTDRLTYLEVYDNLQINDISVFKAAGEMKNEGYEIDLTGLSASLFRIMKNEDMN